MLKLDNRLAAQLIIIINSLDTRWTGGSCRFITLAMDRARKRERESAKFEISSGQFETTLGFRGNCNFHQSSNALVSDTPSKSLWLCQERLAWISVLGSRAQLYQWNDKPSKACNHLEMCCWSNDQVLQRFSVYDQGLDLFLWAEIERESRLTWKLNSCQQL